MNAKAFSETDQIWLCFLCGMNFWFERTDISHTHAFPPISTHVYKNSFVKWENASMKDAAMVMVVKITATTTNDVHFIAKL